MVVGRIINGVVGISGFFDKKMTGRLVGTKTSGRNNEVVVRRGFTVHLLSNPIFYGTITREDICALF